MDLWDLLSHWIAPFISGFAFVICITTWYLSRKMAESARKLREEAYAQFGRADAKYRQAELKYKLSLLTPPTVPNLKVHFVTFDGNVLIGEVKDSYFREGKLWLDVIYEAPKDMYIDLASVVVSTEDEVLGSGSPGGVTRQQWAKGQKMYTAVALGLTKPDAWTVA